jgi:hypothetical protein
MLPTSLANRYALTWYVMEVSVCYCMAACGGCTVTRFVSELGRAGGDNRIIGFDNLRNSMYYQHHSEHTIQLHP